MVWDSGAVSDARLEGLGKGLGFRVQGSGFRVQGLGFIGKSQQYFRALFAYVTPYGPPGCCLGLRASGYGCRI